MNKVSSSGNESKGGVFMSWNVREINSTYLGSRV